MRRDWNGIALVTAVVTAGRRRNSALSLWLSLPVLEAKCLTSPQGPCIRTDACSRKSLATIGQRVMQPCGASRKPVLCIEHNIL